MLSGNHFVQDLNIFHVVCRSDWNYNNSEEIKKFRFSPLFCPRKSQLFINDPKISESDEMDEKSGTRKLIYPE